MCSCVHVTHGYTYRQECERVIVSGTSFVFLVSLPRGLGGGSPGPLLSNLSSSTALMLRRRWRDGSSQGGRGSRPASLAQGVSNICLAMWLENHVLEGNQNLEKPLWGSQEKGMGPPGAGEVWLDSQPWVRGKD